MVCPNCQSNMSDKRKRCERCGTDITLYKKIFRASNQYYNNGLARARVRDLSGAVIALHDSLELNKRNTDARNLLGLIYFEMGETVAALSEWVISRHFKPEDNEADEYIDKVQSNPTKLDILNQAIKRYNNALGSAKQGSDDLAIIQLKKVTSLNPNFLRAYHLLALLFMKNGERDKAKKCLIRAIRIDVSNTITLQYMRELEPSISKSGDSNTEAEQSITSSIIPMTTYREDKPNIIAYVNLVIGVMIGLAVFAFLLLPTIEKNRTKEDNSDYINYSEGLAQQEEKQDAINALQQDKDELQLEIDQLRTQIENFVIPEETPELYNPLFVALAQYMTELSKEDENDRDFTAIADTLSSINESKYETETAVGLLNQLKTEIYPIVAELYYDEGHDLYGDREYEDALIELDKARFYDPTDVNAIYFTARTYHRLEDWDNASLYYNIVITDYPDSNRTADAKSYLARIEG